MAWRHGPGVALDARGALRDLRVTVVAEEDVPAYDRIRLSRYVRETDPVSIRTRSPRKASAVAITLVS